MGKILAMDTSATVTVRTGLLCPPLVSAHGQLWLTGTTLFQQTRPFVGGIASFSIAIPSELALNQLTVYAQGSTYADPGGPLGPLGPSGPSANFHDTNALVVTMGTTFP